MRRVTAAALALAMAFSSPALAKPSPAETRMAAGIEADEARAVALLERLVNVNSGTLNTPGVEEVGRMMRAELEPLGFEVRWIPMTHAGRAGHLVAVHRGRAGLKRLLLIGHLDTVFEASSPFQRFQRDPDGTWATGPGADDMKGGLVVMVEALRAMQTAGALKDANITIVLTGDEERPGDPLEVVRADLVAAAKQSDLALEFEALVRSDGKDWGSIARRSSSHWTLTVTAGTGHSSGIFNPDVGDGAAYELARILAAFRTDLTEPYLTYNVGIMAAGATAQLDEAQTSVTAWGKDNIIPASAIARGDLRTLTDEQLERVREKMRVIVAASLPGAKAEISFEDGYPSMPPTDASRAILAALNDVNRDLGLPQMSELDPARRGAGDIAFVAALVPGVAGMGVAGSGAHVEGERVDLSSIPLQAKRAAVLMSRLAAERR
jgi:glutamate carboxypeptidase